jgi:hypothetical protein
MERKTIIILSLISAVFSLVYILLAYYGYLRYCGMYVFSTEKFSRDYTKLDKIHDDKRRVVVSMTATESSIKKIGPVVRSLLDQTVRVDLISIVIPYGRGYMIPKDIENVVSVFKTGKNYGELNCLIPTIMRESESNTLVITVGEDTIYSKDFIEQLLDTYIKNGDKCVVFNESQLSDTIDIKKGVVIPTDIFTESFLNPPEMKEKISKDICTSWLNNYIEKNNIKKVKVSIKENYRCI